MDMLVEKGKRGNKQTSCEISRREFFWRTAGMSAGVFLSGSELIWARGYAKVFNWKKYTGSEGAVVKGAVRGRVVSGGKGVEGVRCSDGYKVVVTDQDGWFSIDAIDSSGGFVFVVTPRGYWTDRFYVTSAEAVKREVEFELEPMDLGDKYTAVYLPDVHLGSGEQENTRKRFGATLDELNGMAERPALAIGGGDICLVSNVGAEYVEMMSRLQMPVRNGLGNHELLVGQADPRGNFNNLFGPSYHSFDYGQVHYVMMDGCLYVPHRRGHDIEGWVSPTELAWLENDLRLVPKDMPTVVAIHIPLMSTFPARYGMSAEDAALAVIRDCCRDEVIGVLKKYNVPLVLQGHAHENERIFLGSIEFVESISVCGSWWQARKGRENGVSGEPRGYRLLEVNGTRIVHRYVSSAESRVEEPGEFVNLRDGKLVSGKELVVNFFDASNEAEVSGRVGGGSWVAWEPARTGSYKLKAHHWKSPDGFLGSGGPEVEVRCRDRGRGEEQLVGRLQLG
ncbi:MAG: calcineurin-like phosphoesterase C-terminal domain-containing protein [Sedimentisphaerales bacterium]|nr:calcineurin-like phosphoesterase C-terminal domain-containing protein [Sedimentisphaerales bacterium]